MPKRTATKPVIQTQLDSVTKVEAKFEPKKELKPKTQKTNTSSGYTLIISEKPNAARRIAEALGDKIEEHKEDSVYYYEIENNKEKIIVASAVGHLFTLSDRGKGWVYPAFDVDWMPSYNLQQSSFTKRYFDVLKNLAKNATSFVNGCDLDREGELIFKNILKFICEKEDAKRMKFSTLTKPDLVEAYKNMAPHIDFGLAEAGESRHFLDYLKHQ